MAKPAATKSKAPQRAEDPSDEEQHSDVEQQEQEVSGSDAEEDEDEDDEEGDDEPAGDVDDEDEEEDGDHADDGGDSDGSDGASDADEYPVGGDDDDGDEELEAVGFGDAMSKVLQQNVGEDAAPILAKRTTARMREIMNEKKEIKKDRVGAAEKRAKERKDNVVPSHATATKDRQLRKIATKGVVALFNAIAKHQHQAGKIADTDDKKVKELSKENFLGLLKGASQKDKAPAKTDRAGETKSTWSVLQDDYMMGAKLKDWDATHSNNDAGRARRRGNEKDQGDASDPEAAEEKAWKQVGALDSDDDDSAAAATSSKRKAAANASTQKKKAKRS